jgi:hypothetical protein
MAYGVWSEKDYGYRLSLIAYRRNLILRSALCAGWRWAPDVVGAVQQGRVAH